MKKITIPFTILLFISCNQGYKKAEDPQDAGRQFIRASLDGDYDRAMFYILKDTTNISFLRKWKDEYDKLSSDEKREYKNAEIRPVSIEQQPDSSVNYTFTNSYKQKDTTVINIVKVKEEWLVDFKHLH
jgi:hypothetical protein